MNHSVASFMVYHFYAMIFQSGDYIVNHKEDTVFIAEYITHTKNDINPSYSEEGFYHVIMPNIEQ